MSISWGFLYQIMLCFWLKMEGKIRKIEISNTNTTFGGSGSSFQKKCYINLHKTIRTFFMQTEHVYDVDIPNA
jgi:hypothetical protein